MGRKDKKRRKDLEAAAEGGASSDLNAESITVRGKKTIAAGIVVLILGFVVLSFSDPEGKNWASLLSPVLILGSYALIAVGIFLPDATDLASARSVPPSAAQEPPAAAQPPSSAPSTGA